MHFIWIRLSIETYALIVLSGLTPVSSAGQAPNPWFDKLTMTLVTLSLSKGGFADPSNMMAGKQGGE
jgi:hypothetical protein